jgi:hypothetical protein
LKVISPLSAANSAEKKLLEAAIKGLKTNIDKGVEFALSSGAKL